MPNATRTQEILQTLSKNQLISFIERMTVEITRQETTITDLKTDYLELDGMYERLLEDYNTMKSEVLEEVGMIEDAIRTRDNRISELEEENTTLLQMVIQPIEIGPNEARIIREHDEARDALLRGQRRTRRRLQFPNDSDTTEHTDQDTSPEYDPMSDGSLN